MKVTNISKSLSIITKERMQRGYDSKSHVIKGIIPVPNYKVFVKNSSNKNAFATFVSKYVATRAPIILSEYQSVVLA